MLSTDDRPGFDPDAELHDLARRLNKERHRDPTAFVSLLRELRARAAVFGVDPEPFERWAMSGRM